MLRPENETRDDWGGLLIDFDYAFIFRDVKGADFWDTIDKNEDGEVDKAGTVDEADEVGKAGAVDEAGKAGAIDEAGKAGAVDEAGKADKAGELRESELFDRTVCL